MKIESIIPYQVINSRGIPSLEVIFKVQGRHPVVVKSPQGASCGWEEPNDLTDNDEDSWSGRSLEKAKDRVRFFANILEGRHFSDPNEFDQYLLENGLDVSSEVNVSLGLSFGFGLNYLYSNFSTRKDLQKSLRPMLNFINGGAHAQGGLSIQEVMLLPLGDKPSENLEMGSLVYQNLKKYLKKNKLSTAVGDEGGFVLSHVDTHQALEIFEYICYESGLKKHSDYQFSLDCAANEYYDNEHHLYVVDSNSYTAESYQKWLLELVEKFPIYSVEDPFAESDHLSYSSFMQAKKDDLIVVGDDLITSNSDKLSNAIDKKLANALILKPNQNGLFSSFTNTIHLAQENNFKTIFSHRSGDTEDHWLTDLALYFSGDYLKAGALSRSERLAKYNQLLRFEQGLKIV